MVSEKPSAKVWQMRLKLDLSGEIPQMAERTVTRAGTAYQQDVTNIGKRERLSPSGK